MKKLIPALAIILTACGLFAIDGQILLSKQSNLNDMFAGILPDRPPPVTTTASVVKNEPVYIYVIFRGAQADKEGNAKITGSFSVMFPDGRQMANFPDETFTMPVQNETENAVYLLPFPIEMIVNTPDPPGKYRIRVTLKDESSGRNRELVSALDVTGTPEQKADAEPLEAMKNFYRAPNAQNIIPAFREYLKKLPELQKKQGKKFSPTSMLAMFYFALKANPQLYPEWLAMTKTLKDPLEIQCAMVICKTLDDPAFAELKGNAAYDKVPLTFFKVPPVPAHTIQLDILWSEFLVTGGKKPVIKIARTTARLNNAMKPEDYKKLKNPSQKDQLKLMDYVLGVAAMWSLESNAVQHPLAAFYLEAALKRKEFAEPVVEAAITKVLQNVNEKIKK